MGFILSKVAGFLFSRLVGTSLLAGLAGVAHFAINHFGQTHQALGAAAVEQTRLIEINKDNLLAFQKQKDVTAQLERKLQAERDRRIISQKELIAMNDRITAFESEGEGVVCAPGCTLPPALIENLR